MALPSPPAAPTECPLCARAPPTDGGPEALFAFPCCEQRACAACAAAWVGKTAADDFYRASNSSRRFRRGGACPFCRAPAAPPTVRALQVRRRDAVGCGEGVQRGRRGGKGGGEDAHCGIARSESCPRRGDGVPRPGARFPAKGRSPATRGAQHVYRCCVAEQDGRQRRQRRWQRQRRREMLPMFFLGGESWNAMDPSKCVRVWVSQRWPVAKVTTSRAADSCAGNQYDSPAARTRAWGLPKVYGTSRVFRNIRVFTRSRFDAAGHTAAWLTVAAPSRNVYASARPHRSVGVTGSRRGKHRRLAGWRLGKAAATGGA